MKGRLKPLRAVLEIGQMLGEFAGDFSGAKIRSCESLCLCVHNSDFELGKPIMRFLSPSLYQRRRTHHEIWLVLSLWEDIVSC